MKHDNYSAGLWHECDDQILGEDGLVIFRATENVLVKDQHLANVQRVVACVNAFDGIETERLAGRSLGEFLAGEVRLNKAEPKPDGSFGFTFSGFAVQIMAESFADQFRESGAVNYLELLFEHKEIGPLTVTMQRTQGLTPAQKLAKAEAERDELARQVSALQLSHDNIINSLGIKGDTRGSRWVDASGDCEGDIYYEEQWHIIAERRQITEPVWDGDGLPPVGSMVELNSEQYADYEWVSAKVVFYHNGEIIVVVDMPGEPVDQQMSKHSAGFDGAKFRPIRHT